MRAIVTSCGFFSVVQDALAQAVRVPVFTSSLLLVPLLHLVEFVYRRIVQRRYDGFVANVDVGSDQLAGTLAAQSRPLNQ